MPRGFCIFLSRRILRKLPSRLATSTRFNAESVQKIRRETQSTAIPSGLPNPRREKKKNNHENYPFEDSSDNQIKYLQQ